MVKSQDTPIIRAGFIIVAVVAMSQLVCTFPQYQLPPIQNAIMLQTGMTQSQYVQCFTAPMLPAVFFSLIAGILVDKLGPKWVIGVTIVFSTAGSFARMLADSFPAYMLAMALTGVAPAFIYACCPKIMGQWFPKEKLSLAIGAMMIGGNLSSLIATSTTVLFPSTDSAYIFSGVICAVILVIWFIFMKNSNPESPVKEEQAAVRSESVLDILKIVIKSKTILIIGVCMLFNMGFFMTISSSAPSALQSIGYSPKVSSLLATALAVGSPLGSLLGSSLAQKSGNPKRFMQIVMAATILTMPFLWKTGSPVLTVLSLLISAFAFSTCNITIVAIPASLPGIGQRYAGTAGGMLATIQMLGAITIPSRVIVPLARGNYSTLFYLAAGSFLISLLLLFLLPSNNSPARI